MRQPILTWSSLAGGLKKPSGPVILVCFAACIGISAAVAYQYGAGGARQEGNRQVAPEVEDRPIVADSVSSAKKRFVNGDASPDSVSSISDVGSLSPRNIPATTPDEERVVRGDKRDRVLKVAPVAPPKSFNAGSVLERKSLLTKPQPDGGVKMAFAKPEIEGKGIEIAKAFHVKQKKQRKPEMMPVVAKLVTNDKPDILATAYAPVDPDYARSSPFETLLRDDRNNGRFIPPVAKGDHDWMATPLPASVFGKEEQKCLATAVYFEARGEDAKGQAAVAQVVLNRVRNPAYPDTICDVVYQNDNLRNGCQFSFACDGIKDRITSRRHYRMAEEIAMAVTAGRIFIPEIGSSTHYHATYVRPHWSKTMKKMQKIGLHIFYRTYGGGWS